MRRIISKLWLAFILAWTGLGALSRARAAADAPAANPFYAMDTSFHRPPLNVDQQLALVKELGYDGVAWTDESPKELAQSVSAIESHGLRIVAIYFGGSIDAGGKLTLAPHLAADLDVLKGHADIVWLHIGGAGPSFASLAPDSSAVVQLRELAADAAKRDLRIALYPHFGEWTAHFGDAVHLARLVNHRAFGVTFNLCHCLAVGDEKKIPDLLESAGPLLFTVTICGADAGVTGGDWKRLIQPLGSGSFDIASLLRKLRQLGFAGPIGFQGYGIAGDARSVLEPTMRAWKQFLVK